MTITDTKSGLTVERLKALLDYDPITGIFRWRISPRKQTPAGSVAGDMRGDGYWRIKLDGVRYLGHRLAWFHFYGEWPPGGLDHKDLVPHHNWIENLRPATQTENNANTLRRINNRSGFKGVFYLGPGRWRAGISFHSKTLYIGTYDEPGAAHAAYVAKAKELFGEFSNAGR